MSSHPKKRNKRTKGRGGRNATASRKLIANTTNDIMPPVHRCIMSYNDATFVRAAVGSTYNAFRFRANDIYDPDPLLGTGGLAGFAAMILLYREFRVLRCEATWEVTNLETFPIRIGITFSTYDVVASIGSRVAALNVLEGQYSSGLRTLSQGGGLDRAKIVFGANLANVWGNRQEYNDDISFAGISISPTRPLYINFIVASALPGVSGIFQGLKIRFLTKWDARQTDLT